jgi:CubicO group peptidase (beta-lactamase class C family)
MEKASGKNLPDWIKQRIFDPLKMNNTRMQKNALDVVPNRATKYEAEGNGLGKTMFRKHHQEGIIIFSPVRMTW